MPDINVNKLSEALNTKADIDLNNTGVFSTTGGGVNLVQSTPSDATSKEVTTADFIKSDIQSNLLNYTTNRILEIPQDIKLELNNGTLTLKAGSKVYDGLGNSYIVPNDIVASTPSGAQNKQLIVLKKDFSQLIFVGVNPYDTNLTFNQTTGMSDYQGVEIGYLPIGISTKNDTQYTSIEQVFNGFGYIGYIVFALPGVKVQYPDGLNTDGSWKTGIYTTTSVSTFQNLATTGFARVMIDCDSGTLICPDESTIGIGKRRVWDSDKNLWTIDGVKIHYAEIGRMCGETTHPYIITSVQQYTVDSVANSNASNFSQAGRSYLSSLGIPGGKSIKLTVGANGTTYIAPANGWFYICVTATANGASYNMYDTNGYGVMHSNLAANSSYKACMPIIAGHTLYFGYRNLDFTSHDFLGMWFFYAQGDE